MLTHGGWRLFETIRLGRMPRPAHPRARIYLWIAAAIFVLSAVPFTVQQSPVARAATTQSAIQIENQNPGDPNWDQFASVAKQDAIDGYASPLSVNHGQSVDFYITTTAASYTIKIYRTGWYGGAGARLMLGPLGPFTGMHQAIPAPDSATGMVSCDGKWQKSYTLNVPSTWTTGVYLARLDASNGDSSFIFFVVRDDGGHEAIEFQTSVTTYQAYNVWGGVSLYDNTTNSSVYKYANATKVSFDRPFDPLDSNGAGHYLYDEYPFIRWAESQGYDLTYVTDVDTHANTNPLTNHQAFLSVGHDEYWSKGMRDNVQAAINAGVNVAFFSGNAMYWQIRFEPNSDGVANRVEVGYKEFAESTSAPGPDPQWGVNNAIVTDNWRSPVVNQPENAVMGVMYDGQVPNNNYPYVVQNASSWVYAGTGFTNGTSVPGIVGYEYDKVWNNGYSPAGLTTLSNSPVCCSDTQWDTSNNTHANSTIYTAASGARVFAAGTIDWASGLDNYTGEGHVNPGIQKTTANILANFTSGAGTAAASVTLSPTSLTFSSQTVNTTSSSQVVMLTNSGNATLNITGISIVGTNAGDFAQTNTCGSSVAASGSCTISVTFTPSATGTRSASLSIADNASGSPQTVALSGTGAAASAPAVTLNPMSLSFGNQNVNTTSAAQTVTLSNSGNAALSINGIAITGTNAADFAQTNTCPSSLAANASCTISVTFTPSATGTRYASLSIADNASGSPQTVALSGTGATTSSVIFSDGFESGTLPGSWTGTTVSSGNTLKIDNTLAHSGSDSLLAITARNTAGDAYVTKTFAGQTTLDVRAYYYLSNPVNWGEVNIMSLYAQGNFIGWVDYYADPTSPALQVYNGTTYVLYNCTLPTLNAWHSIELQYVLSTTTTGSFTVWLDGTKACGATGIRTSSSSGLTINQVNLGIESADSSVGLSVHVDDAIISKSYIGV